MSTIYDKEQALFAEWIEHEKWTGDSEEYLNGHFCWDGLHFTGMPSERIDGKDGHSYRIMNGDNKQEEIWKNAFIKPLFLCKDYNGDESVDVREETGYSDEKLYWRFFKKYLILLYALTNFNQKTQSFPSYEECCIKENYWLGDKGFFHAPVVRMNLKKVAGGSSCPDSLLQKYVNNDYQYITRQIDLYDANVFVCCHSGEVLNPIWDLMWWNKDLKQGLFKEELRQFDKTDYSFWYSEEQKKVILSVPHMSKIVDAWEFYRPIPIFERFLREREGFFNR